MNIRRELWVVGLFLTVILLAFGGLTWRLFDLKHNQKDNYEGISSSQLSSFYNQQPRRGMILDAKGRVLAASTETYNAFVEPRRLQTFPDQILVAANQLQDILQIPGPEICRMIEESRNPGYLILKSEISPTEREKISQVRKQIPALNTDSDWRRSYPAGNLTAHILGFVGADDDGLTGIELKYNNILAGQSGKSVYVVDVSRRKIASQAIESCDPVDGDNLVLTIDSVIQRFAYEALKNKMDEYEAESAVAVVMDPWTGAILAMVSLPDYDPTDFSRHHKTACVIVC